MMLASLRQVLARGAAARGSAYTEVGTCARHVLRGAKAPSPSYEQRALCSVNKAAFLCAPINIHEPLHTPQAPLAIMSVARRARTADLFARSAAHKICASTPGHHATSAAPVVNILARTVTTLVAPLVNTIPESIINIK